MRFITLLLCALPVFAHAQFSVSDRPTDDRHQFTLVDDRATDILYDANDEKLVEITAGFLADDVEKVTGKRPTISTEAGGATDRLVVIGTVGESALIDELVRKGKLSVKEIDGEWERFIVQTVKRPMKGVKEALVIAGSDKRGTAYGVLTLSKEMGVSPWYYWADAPVQKKAAVYVSRDRYVSEGPSVKYRGIFLNDEAPALTGWVEENFGSFNHEFYEKVFELLLRNKANYLWPAMWRPRVFSTDDPENLQTADDYGIVISTSHHEPMMRYHEEWSRYDGGAWNYETNAPKLREFWRGGIERMGDYESVVTLGMRGDGDEAMSEGTAVPLLQRIIADQREIITDVTGKPVEETPQVWALYKEVQDYYDKGMRVDDDILVLFCDDNWGNVRILPKKEDMDHAGGYGMYYHFDFVGGPVSYRWLNVTQIERVWEQMNLSYEWGVRDLWITNVGDLKPMELPISFFLDFGWNADMEAADLPGYYADWAAQQFGSERSEEIADILALSTKYSARRTPEMIKPDTYSLDNYREAERVLQAYDALYERSTAVYEDLDEAARDAYYQLVHFPIEISRNLNEMYVAAGKNQQYAMQQRASANYYADLTKEKFERDAELIRYYHDTLADGKWNHFMAQNHIGYTSWAEPPVDRMPAITYIRTPQAAALGYVVEHGPGSRWARGGLYSRTFPAFDPLNDQQYYLEVFNQGTEPLTYTVHAIEDWIELSSSGGEIQYEEKVTVSIDWSRVPEAVRSGTVVLSDGDREFTVAVPLRTPNVEAAGFLENNGVVSIEATNFTAKVDGEHVHWTLVPNLGRTHSAMTPEPADAEPQSPAAGAPRLEYTFTLLDSAAVTVETHLSPTLNYKKNEGLRYAIAIDDEEPRIVNIHAGEDQPDWEYPEWWNTSVTDHIRKKQSEHGELLPGQHTLKVWMVDPGVVFQQFIIDAGGLKPSYLGPPESTFFGAVR
ncbi:glycosyl hydrolase family 115 (putative glucuronidase) [Neolewinella xylanilytica]|uniref:Glycosyl hydrolase family 115 (Putative glucuronidase) n=1 Tax=Neolewinella xylanilytica TaxID=1514080 RepID=A0A2S6I8B7_9BACT|nr:glycosyl hydrolase 115 family protein [Neolewinella xylanilytica]PPK87719.1 glycosyl hydrolase family 115 (putative glucuronidase) [Neolewinella xylanilytica]